MNTEVSSTTGTGPTSAKIPLAELQDSLNKEIIEHIAQMAHWANRSYCHMLGDHSQPKWEDAPQWQKDSAITGVKMHLANPNASPADSHESWYAQKLEDGWKYGTVKDPEKKEHPCMVAYEELPFEQQMKDSIYGGVVKAMLKKYIAAGQLAVDRKPTPGEKRMGVAFNPGRSPQVDNIKRAFADLHDLLVKECEVAKNGIINREVRKYMATLPHEEQVKIMAEGGPRLPFPEEASECGRTMAIALTHIQTAKMYAVESVTR